MTQTSKRRKPQRKWSLKYELTDHTITHDNKILHRIRALRSFGSVGRGDLGGWIEHKRNLSHRGDCWVSGEAKVLNGGRVTEDAMLYDSCVVRDHAMVKGRAEVQDEAEISEHAQVGDEACVAGKAQVGGFAKVVDRATVYDNAGVYGWAIIADDANVHGTAEVGGKVAIGSNTDLTSGRHLGEDTSAKPAPRVSNRTVIPHQPPTPLAPRRTAPSSEKPPDHLSKLEEIARPPSNTGYDLTKLLNENAELKRLLSEIKNLAEVEARK